jgi:hypothetical protein
LVERLRRASQANRAGAPAASSANFVQIEPWWSVGDGIVGRPSSLKPTSVKYKRLILF